jgi:5-methylcytosine-specific restriction endonuclease McrA
MKTSTLAAILERELLRTEEPTKTSDARECFACGRPFMPRPSTGDDNMHAFCSARCREACDAGFPTYGSWKVDAFDVLISAWRVVAGPAGVEIGSQYYAPIIEAVERQRKRLARSRSGEELIRPRRLCQRCGAKLPVWINGKQVRSDRKFCTACSPNPRSGTRARSGGLAAKKVA